MTAATVDQAIVEQAARLAEVLNADPQATEPGDEPWTAQDVINVALLRGLAQLEQVYLSDDVFRPMA